MKKRHLMMTIAAAVMMMAAVPVFAQEETEAEAVALEDWAYAGLALNSEDAGVGTIYYTKAYFEGSDLINPMTVEPYTEEELSAIAEGAVVGAEGYVVNVPAGASVGMEIYGTDTCIYWYDAENAAGIVSSADPLALDAESGAMLNGDGEVVAEAMPALEDWAYGALTLDSEDLGVGTIYYAAEYFALEDGEEIAIINPVTVAPYTLAEIDLIISGAVEGNDRYVANIPEGAILGISAPGNGDIAWFDAENAANIVSSADALIVDTAAGTVTDLSGEAVAEAIAD